MFVDEEVMHAHNAGIVRGTIINAEGKAIRVHVPTL